MGQGCKHERYDPPPREERIPTFATSPLKCYFLNDDVVAKIKALKKEDGPTIQVHGSGVLVQTLLKNDLIDELRLRIFPVTIGTGQRLFAEGTIPAAFTVLNSEVLPNGIIIANYKRAGEFKTGSLI